MSMQQAKNDDSYETGAMSVSTKRKRLCRVIPQTGFLFLGFVLLAAQLKALPQQSDSELSFHVSKRFELGEQKPFSGKGGNANAAFCPDKDLVAFTDYQGKVTLWDVEEEQLVSEFELGEEASTNIDISRDGELLAAGSYLGKVRIWDIQDEKLVSEFEGLPGYKKGQRFAGGVAIRFSDDASLLVCASPDDKFHIWNVKDGSLVNTIERPKRSYLAGIEMDGDYMYSWGQRGKITKRDLRTGESIAEVNRMGVSSFAVLEDGRLAIGSYRGVSLRDELKSKENQLLGDEANWACYQIAVSPDSRYLVSASYRQLPYQPGEAPSRPVLELLVYDCESGELENAIGNIPGWPTKLAFTSDSRSVIYFSNSISGIEIFDVDTGEPRYGDLDGHRGSIRQLKFIDGADRLFSYGQDSSARIWDLDDKEEEYRIQRTFVNAVDPLSDGERLAMVDGRQNVEIVNLENDEIEQRFEIKKQQGSRFFAFSKALKSAMSGSSSGPISIRSLIVTPDNDLVTYGLRYPNEIQFSKWNLESGDQLLNETFELSKLATPPNPSRANQPWQVTFSPAGGHAAFVWAKKLFLFDLDTSEMSGYKSPEDFRMGPFVRGGTHLLTHEKGKLRIWDVTNGEHETVEIDDEGNVFCHCANEHYAVFANFPQGKTARIKMRRTSDWKVVLDEEIEEGTNYQSYAISPKGRRLALGRADGVIEIWHLSK